MTVQLKRWSGVFESGWTPDGLEPSLAELSELLDMKVVCVWNDITTSGPAGDSELLVISGGQVRELPAGLWELLLDGEGDGQIDAVPGPVRAEIERYRLVWVTHHQACHLSGPA